MRECFHVRVFACLCVYVCMCVLEKMEQVQFKIPRVDFDLAK